MRFERQEKRGGGVRACAFERMYWGRVQVRGRNSKRRGLLVQVEGQSRCRIGREWRRVRLPLRELRFDVVKTADKLDQRDLEWKNNSCYM